MENNAEDIMYGSFPLFEKLRMLAEWMPLVGRLQLVAAATNPHDQALAVIAAAQWAAGKTETGFDDDSLRHLEAVLKTPEGKALFDFVLSKFGASI
jgi:hypothetical protein